MSCVSSVHSLTIYIGTHLPAPVLCQSKLALLHGRRRNCKSHCWQQIILTPMLYFIDFVSSDIWYHKSVQTQGWGFYKYIPPVRRLTAFKSQSVPEPCGRREEQGEGGGRCLISPLTSFISSPCVLQDMFLVLMAKVLQSRGKCGPQMC